MNEAEAGTTALTERQRYWLDHLRACAASGKSIAKYAAVHDLAAPAMYAGKRVLVKKGALPSKHPAQFQRVQLMKAVVDREPGRVHSMHQKTIIMEMNDEYFTN
ncbi:MAG: hypothetical protein L3J94_04725 [Gammaproteobacteria bacterium]|nr:hypothetical protein [Gammaproteobacteria bacterium]